MEKRTFNCTRDEYVIRGHVFIPEGNPKPWPTVILSHSFGSSEKETMPYAEVLSKNGFCCFTYNFCGGSLGPTPEDVEKSDGDFSQMTIESEMADLCAVIQFAKQQNFVQPKGLTLIGGSQGGFISARVAAKLPEDIQTLVMLYPALCIPEDSRSGQMLFFKFDPNNVPDFIEADAMPGLRLNGAYVKQSQSIDICAELRSFPGKVVIMHGTKDEVVAFSYAEKIVEVRPETVLVTMEDATHGFPGEAKELAIKYALQVALGEL